VRRPLPLKETLCDRGIFGEEEALFKKGARFGRVRPKRKGCLVCSDPVRIVKGVDQREKMMIQTFTKRVMSMLDEQGEFHASHDRMITSFYHTLETFKARNV
jgi:hypothetical protein